MKKGPHIITRYFWTAVFLTSFHQGVTAAKQGDITIDLRLRIETAEIDGLEDADNESARLRLGYFSPELKGFKFGAEGEITSVYSHDSYNAAGVHGYTALNLLRFP